MTPPLKVLHVHSGNLYGGVESMLGTIARHADRAHLDSRFALCFPGRFGQEIAAAGIHVDQLGPVRMSRPWTAWRARAALRRVLKREAFDAAVVHSGWTQSIFGGVLRRAGMPLVRWMHARPDRANWLERLATQVTPDLVICNSRYTAEGVAREFPHVPHTIVRPAVAEPATTGARAQMRRDIRAELGVTDDARNVIVQAGRIEPGKGHRILLDALARLRDRNDWVMWEVGAPQRPEERSYLGRLAVMAARYGIADRVRFIGERTDVPAILAAADIYCQPNVVPESFGITFVEALYAGLPVVTTAMGGGEEIVDPSCGRLVLNGDSDSLSVVLRSLLANPAERRRLGAAGPARAHALCDPAGRIAELTTALARWRKN